MAQPEQIAITVAYALPERQSVVALKVSAGSSALEAVQKSGLLTRHADIESRPLELAIFGRPIAAATPLRHGDRIEILRPLLHDPKDTRRQLSRYGRTMGRPQKR